MAAHPGTQQILMDLVAIPSVGQEPVPEGREGGEARVCRYLAGLLESAGVDCQMEDVLPGRPNLYAHLDRGCARTVILSAHTDTVPATDWEGDPFRPEEKDGLIFGRGSCDTKASLAAFTAVMLEAARKGAGEFNLIFAAVCDEEVSFAGSRAAAGRLRADLAIVGEPTSLAVVHRHKGVMRFVLEARGRSCHSSTPEKGDNAIYRMSRAALAVERLAGDWQQVRDADLGPRAISVTTISGGQAPNIVPDLCRADVDVRCLPGDRLEDLLEEVRARTGNDAAVLAPYMEGPALDTDPEHPLVRRLAEASGRGLTCAPYATDAPQYASRGIPAVVFGPGDVTLAHTPREHIRLAEVDECVTILRRFLGM